MRRKPLTLVLAGLLMVSLLLVGCRRSAVPPVEELTPEDEAAAALQEAQGNTTESPVPTAEPPEMPATEEPDTTAEETPEPTEVPSEPTEAPTATPELVDLPTVVPTPEPLEQTTPVPTTDGATSYVVKPGDNLFRIALNYGVTVEALSQANNITNPSLIYVGQQLTIPSGGTTPPTTPPPGQACSNVYTVQPGDNLFRIALRYNYSQLYLAQVNGIANPSLVYVGQQICIP